MSTICLLLHESPRHLENVSSKDLNERVRERVENERKWMVREWAWEERRRVRKRRGGRVGRRRGWGVEVGRRGSRPGACSSPMLSSSSVSVGEWGGGRGGRTGDGDYLGSMATSGR
jgi:hypothetical protein